MKKLLLILFILTLSSTYSYGQETGVSCIIEDVRVEAKSEEDCKKIGGSTLRAYLFVINFDTGTFDGKKLRLNGNGSSNVIYFTDRPDREAGHMSVKKFKSIWTKGINSFNSDPPNATLSVIEKGKDSNSVMILKKPAIEENSIIFDVKLIEGSPPEKFDTGGLFIDSINILW
ncbi:MAG: hypothetical protein ACR2NC_05275 [Thermodesulfobacteriota bacterium]